MFIKKNSKTENLIKAVAMKVATAVFVSVLALTPILDVQAVTKQELQNKKNQTQKELNAATNKLGQLEGEQEEIAEELEEIKSLITVNLAAIELLEKQIAETQEKINIKQAAYNDALAKEKAQYEAMKIRMKYMYEKGNISYAQLILEANSLGEALNKADYIDQLYAYDRRLLEEYQETKAEVRREREELEEERAELQASEESLEEEKAALEEHKAEVQEKYDDYEALIEEAAVAATALRRSLEATNAAIREKEEEEARIAAEARRAAEEAARKAAGETGTTAPAKKTYAPPGSATGQNVANYACQFVGNPYVYGGTSLTNGCDCSGFVMSVYKQFGVSMPRTAESMRGVGAEVGSIDEACPGDVVCYPGHVGIYIGNGTIVHASTAKTGIKYSPVTYRAFITIRRIV